MLWREDPAGMSPFIVSDFSCLLLHTLSLDVLVDLLDQSLQNSAWA